MKAASETLDSIVIKRPRLQKYRRRQHLYLDKGYDFQEIELEVVIKGIRTAAYTPQESEEDNSIKKRSDDGQL